jgi:hypothetical protein
VNTPSFNDLVGLPFRWGARPARDHATDCFQLVAEGLARYGRGDWSPRFDWVYQEYGERLPCTLIYRLVVLHGQRVKSASPGIVGYLPTDGRGALALCTDHGLLFIGPGERVVHAPAAAAPKPLAHFWFPCLT